MKNIKERGHQTSRESMLKVERTKNSIPWVSLEPAVTQDWNIIPTPARRLPSHFKGGLAFVSWTYSKSLVHRREILGSQRKQDSWWHQTYRHSRPETSDIRFGLSVIKTRLLRWATSFKEQDPFEHWFDPFGQSRCYIQTIDSFFEKDYQGQKKKKLTDVFSGCLLL